MDAVEAFILQKLTIHSVPELILYAVRKGHNQLGIAHETSGSPQYGYFGLQVSADFLVVVSPASILCEGYQELPLG